MSRHVTCWFQISQSSFEQWGDLDISWGVITLLKENERKKRIGLGRIATSPVTSYVQTNSEVLEWHSFKNARIHT